MITTFRNGAPIRLAATLFTTSAPVWSDEKPVRIGWRKLVPMVAVRSRLNSNKTREKIGSYVCSPNILSFSDRFQVCRIHACTIAAQVVYFAIWWDRTNPVFVRDAMRQHLPHIQRQATVSTLKAIAEPDPTTVIGLFLDFAFKARELFRSHLHILPHVEPA